MSLKDTHLHLTNVAVQKSAPGYDREAGCKWQLHNLKHFLVTQHGQDAVNQMFREMNLLILRSLQVFVCV